MFSDIGFVILGVCFGACLVLAAWQWWLGREQTKYEADIYADYHNEYYNPTPVQKEQVDGFVVSHVKKARSKRIASRKKPVRKPSRKGTRKSTRRGQ